jgi:hypothetical protein
MWLAACIVVEIEKAALRSLTIALPALTDQIIVSTRRSMVSGGLCRPNQNSTCACVYTLVSLKLAYEVCNSSQPALNLTSISNQSHQSTNLQMIAQNDLDDLQTNTVKHQDNDLPRQGYKISQSVCRQTRQMPPSTCKRPHPQQDARKHETGKRTLARK